MLQTTAAPKSLRWQRHRSSPLARQVDISRAVGQLAYYLWWDSLPKESGYSSTQRSSTHRSQRAQWLARTLLDLGPTFIKLGQALSTRADLLPLEYVKALGQLQDGVPGFDPNCAIAIIESELGHPLHTLYQAFERTPIAAASLGQVHRARLYTGEEVVVKVQRPGLEDLFETDFQVLGRLVTWITRFFPIAKHYDLKAIHQEFSEILSREIDYVQEAMNADRFRHNFADHPRIVVPKIYPRYTTQRVLTMEYVPGIKVNDRHRLSAIGLDPKDVNHLGICAYLKQLLQDGFFQADPHPGNMAVSYDGKLIFYDFGMMAEVQPINRNQMVQTFFAVLKKDTDQVIQTMMDMGLIEPMSDMTPIKRIVSVLVERFADKPIEVEAFKSLRNELYTVFEQQPFRLPAKMTFIVKALTTLDGVARDLDPQYNLLAAAKPFVKSLATLPASQGGGVGELARQARSFVTYQLTKPNGTQQAIRRLEERLAQGELQMQAQLMERDRAIKLLKLTIKILIYGSVAAFAALVGVLLLGNAAHTGGAIAAFVTAAGSAVMVLKGLIQFLFHRRISRFVDQ
ncbi:ABC1 kinase family protein [Myxacorys almedinensis]|uniref:AarF/ABC1/UbiB kinase family protein n=1 Tax=Myxacorys almedinensis A TaxID=2690445 RepID=A0A8J7Z1Q6_9CYAN|nr:AarF/ABC1/UbiB kinase family protein [Myxacorys almedinensis]NDJ18039.1 AarF/ABC1/UbiB kinase family protein [Myxacorys almedinensis A]